MLGEFTWSYKFTQPLTRGQSIRHPILLVPRKCIEITKSGGRLHGFECDGDVGIFLSPFARCMYHLTHVLFVLPA